VNPAQLRAEMAESLEGRGITNAAREAGWLVEAATGLDNAEQSLATEPLTEGAIAGARALLARRMAGEPLQYITGKVGFRRLELEIGPGALIPRPETESLTGYAMDRLPSGGVVADVGTGAGAIALAIADERPDAVVYATDVAPEALEWARRNRDRLSLAIELFEGDLLDALPNDLLGSLDVVVSNPPYVHQDFTLPVEIRDHEPHVALFAEEDGMALLDRLAEQSREWLKPGGWLVMEMGEVQRDEMRRTLGRLGYDDVDVLPDMTGRPRVAIGRNPAPE
jgi:release factor glutamine methyltransferase